MVRFFAARVANDGTTHRDIQRDTRHDTTRVPPDPGGQPGDQDVQGCVWRSHGGQRTPSPPRRRSGGGNGGTGGGGGGALNESLVDIRAPRGDRNGDTGGDTDGRIHGPP